MKKVLEILKKIIAILILWFIFHSIFIVYDGLHDKNKKADVAVVLGNKINEDGTPSERLKARLKQSIKLFRDNRVEKIIVSGGLGKEGFWEGDKMKEYLMRKNIPQEKLL